MARHLLNHPPADHATDKHISFIAANSPPPACPFPLACPCTDLASIMHCFDEGALGLCQLLVVGAPEAESVLVRARGGVEPARRVLAGVREALLGRGTQ